MFWENIKTLLLLNLFLRGIFPGFSTEPLNSGQFSKKFFPSKRRKMISIISSVRFVQPVLYWLYDRLKIRIKHRTTCRLGYFEDGTFILSFSYCIFKYFIFVVVVSVCNILYAANSMQLFICSSLYVAISLQLSL